ncbi:Glutamate receptor [Scenedesmus sp. PABB004]|nr:Glutamate receptor [Scenedesmus sp. PABB004]
MTLRVLAADRPPLVFIDDTAGGAPIFRGYLVDLLPTLLQHAGLQLAYDVTAFTGSGGTLGANGTWSGVMGQLTSGRADLALFPLTLTSQRATAIAHTEPFMDDGYGILVRTKQVDPGYSFLLPFQPLTWLCFLMAMLGIMLLVSAIDAVTRRARLRAFARLHGEGFVAKRRRRDKLMSHAIETVMMAVGSGSAPTSRSAAVKLLFVAWAVFSIIMLSAYTANLTANMTVNQMGLAVSSLRDLAAAPAPFGVPAQSSVSAYFANSSDAGARALRHKMLEYPSTPDGVQAVRDGKIAAFINDYATLQYNTQVPPCDLALGAETIGSGQLVLGLAPNASRLADRLNAAMLQLNEAGYMAELRRKWFTESSSCLQEDSKAGGDGRLSMAQAWSVFLILAAGAGAALLVAGLELLYWKRGFKGVHELKRDVSALGIRPALRKRLSRGKLSADLGTPGEAGECGPRSCGVLSGTSLDSEDSALVRDQAGCDYALPGKGGVAAAVRAPPASAGSSPLSQQQHSAGVQLTAQAAAAAEPRRQRQDAVHWGACVESGQGAGGRGGRRGGGHGGHGGTTTDDSSDSD